MSDKPDLGTIVIDEFPAPIERMWLEDGAIRFEAEWCPVSRASNVQDVTVLCPDGSLFCRGNLRLDLSGLPAGSSISVVYVLHVPGQMTAERRQREAANV